MCAYHRIRGQGNRILARGFTMNSHNYPPMLLQAGSAAFYLGVSKSTLLKLNIRRRELGSKRLYDRRDLEAYVDDLLYEGNVNGGVKTYQTAA